jgi:hypothetical protein
MQKKNCSEACTEWNYNTLIQTTEDREPFFLISKYRQPLFATVLQRALLYTYITTCFG